MAHATRKKVKKSGSGPAEGKQAAATKKTEARRDSIYMFRVGLAGLEDRMWREIEIPGEYTLDDLAEFILPLFGADSSYHMWVLRRGRTVYPQVASRPIHRLENEQNPSNVSLKSLNMVRGKSKMELDYDMGSTSTFVIRYMGRRAHADGEEKPSARLVDAHGADIIEDIGGYEIEDLVYRYDQGEKLVSWDEDDYSMVPPGWNPDELGKRAAQMLNDKAGNSR